MKLKNTDRTALIQYICLQLESFFPDGRPVKPQVEDYFDEALTRIHQCINSVLAWEMDVFDYLHSSQYTTFLYFLSNSIWRKEGNEHNVCTKLFLLNKALNGIDCFYEIQMPDIFFIGHSVGIVLAKATYGNYLVLYQNSTVGKNHGVAPVLGSRVVLFPNTAVLGRCEIADGSVISQGVSVINQNTKADSVVYAGTSGTLVFKEPGRSVINDIFRI